MSGQEITVGTVLATDPKFGNVPDLHKVERITATLYVCKHLRVRKDGMKIVDADRLGPWTARVAADSDWMKIRIANAVHKLRMIKLTPDTIDLAEQLIAKAGGK